MKTKERFIDNWITTLLGMLFIVFAGVLIWFERDVIYITLALGTGIGLAFAKDKLIKKYFNTQ